MILVEVGLIYIEVWNYNWFLGKLFCYYFWNFVGELVVRIRVVVDFCGGLEGVRKVLLVLGYRRWYYKCGILVCLIF